MPAGVERVIAGKECKLSESSRKFISTHRAAIRFGEVTVVKPLSSDKQESEVRIVRWPTWICCLQLAEADVLRVVPPAKIHGILESYHSKQGYVGYEALHELVSAARHLL